MMGENRSFDTYKHQRDDGQLLSKTVAALRFPLIAGVVLLHVEIPVDAESHPIAASVKYLLYNGLADLAVPLFFFISGYLFFYKTTFSLSKYVEKLKRRFHTLVVPYIFWNLAFMALVGGIQVCVPALNNRRLLSDYSFVDLLNSFWNYSGLGYGCPILGPTWFLRDLILMVLATPVLYLLIRYTKGLFILLLSACYLGDVYIGLMGFPKSWLFFCLGAFFSIFKLDFAVFCRKWFPYLLPVGIIFLLTIVSLHIIGKDNGVLLRLYIVVGIFTVISLVAEIQYENGGKVCALLAESSFFVYVFHGFFIHPLSNLYSRMVTLNDFTAISGYFIVTVIACTVSWGGYVLLKNYTPKFCSFIVGGR